VSLFDPISRPGGAAATLGGPFSPGAARPPRTKPIGNQAMTADRIGLAEIRGAKRD
jgi:hypothetical protein